MDYHCFCCNVSCPDQIAYQKHCKTSKHIKLNLDQPLLFWEKFTDKFLDIAWADTKLKFCPLYLLSQNLIDYNPFDFLRILYCIDKIENVIWKFNVHYIKLMHIWLNLIRNTVLAN